MGAVDYLCNAFEPEFEVRWDDAIAAQGIPVKVRRDPTDSFCDAATMVARFDEIGVAAACVVASDPQGMHGAFDFSEFTYRPEAAAALVADNPGRFGALWCIDVARGMAGVTRTAEMLEAGWVVGLYNHTHSWDRRFDHADLYPYYALAARYDVPVVMQAGTSGGLAPSECGHPIGIDRPAIYFPTVRFVLSHLGWPWTEEAIAMALKFPNVFLGTAAYPPRHWAAAVREFIAGPGRSKVVFGTNFPTVGHRHALAQFAELGLDDSIASRVLGDNARRVFTRLP